MSCYHYGTFLSFEAMFTMFLILGVINIKLMKNILNLKKN